MDKKNTMLLTIVAVATLLVAVVGATFAYFSVYTTSELGATTVDATVEQVGTVTLSGGGAATLTVTAADMAETKVGSSYPLDKTVNVASATLTGAGENETYYCRFTLDVTNASNMATETADGGLDITVATGVTVTKAGATSDFSKGTDLSPASVAAGKYTVDFTMGKGGTFAGGNLITVTGNIENTSDSSQATRLAGKKIDVDYTVSNFKCDTAPLA